jgi:hypothetical protein
MASTLILHRGGWEATKAGLASVPVPDETDSYVPVPYLRFVEEVELHVPRFGLTITGEQFALAKEGQQMFGVLTCTNGHSQADYALAIGLRSSYDRSLSVGLVAGTHVFCCDNLAFSGEASMHRKHTVNVFRDLPDLIYRMLSRVSAMRERQDAEIASWKARDLPQTDAHHLMVEAIRARAIPASKLPKVIEAWEEPAHPEFTPRNAWSLFNAFTELAKSQSPRTQIEDTLRVTGVFRRVLGLS